MCVYVSVCIIYILYIHIFNILHYIVIVMKKLSCMVNDTEYSDEGEDKEDEIEEEKKEEDHHVPQSTVPKDLCDSSLTTI